MFSVGKIVKNNGHFSPICMSTEKLEMLNQCTYISSMAYSTEHMAHRVKVGTCCWACAALVLKHGTFSGAFGSPSSRLGNGIIGQ
jgi:hypothetical protein